MLSEEELLSSGTTVLTGNPSGNGVRVTCGLLEDTRLHKERTVDVHRACGKLPAPIIRCLIGAALWSDFV